jgi:hypothetical protein
MNDRDTATELRRVGCALSEADVARLRIVAGQDAAAGLEPLGAALRRFEGDARLLMAPAVDTSAIAPGLWGRARFTSYTRGPIGEDKRWHVVLTPPIPTRFGATGRAQVVYLCGHSANLDLVKPAATAGWFWIETCEGDWPAVGPGCRRCLARAVQLGWIGLDEL